MGCRLKLFEEGLRILEHHGKVVNIDSHILTDVVFIPMEPNVRLSLAWSEPKLDEAVKQFVVPPLSRQPKIAECLLNDQDVALELFECWASNDADFLGRVGFQTDIPNVSGPKL